MNKQETLKDLQKLEDILSSFAVFTRVTNHEGTPVNLYKECLSLLENIKRDINISQEDKWISIEDEKPKYGETVITLENCDPSEVHKYLVYCMPEEVSGAIYHTDGKFYLEDPTIDYPIEIFNVTHWKPLTPPPTK